jgi:hypothetical protein
MGEPRRGATGRTGDMTAKEAALAVAVAGVAGITGAWAAVARRHANDREDEIVIQAVDSIPEES